MSTTSKLGLTNDHADGTALSASDVNLIANHLEYARYGYKSIDVAGSGDYTLDTTTEAPYKTLALTGALTAARNIIVPTGADGREWLIYNNTSGAFTLTVKTAAGAGIVIATGKVARLWTDGVRVYRLTADTTPTS